LRTNKWMFSLNEQNVKVGQGLEEVQKILIWFMLR